MFLFCLFFHAYRWSALEQDLPAMKQLMLIRPSITWNFGKQHKKWPTFVTFLHHKLRKTKRLKYGIEIVFKKINANWTGVEKLSKPWKCGHSSVSSTAVSTCMWYLCGGALFAISAERGHLWYFTNNRGPTANCFLAILCLNKCNRIAF
jgi:hypothetical protein